MLRSHSHLAKGLAFLTATAVVLVVAKTVSQRQSGPLATSLSLVSSQGGVRCKLPHGSRRPTLRRNSFVRATNEGAPASQFGRRETLAAGGLGLALSMTNKAKADTEENIFYGTAFPPGTYGGYDPDAKNKAVYTFAFPEGWRTDPPSKVEKGTKGIDGRVFNPEISKKGEQAFVIVLSRAGEDNKSFQLKDAEATFSGFEIADPDLQVALENADEIKKSSKSVGGLDFFTYEINGVGNNYLSSITVNNEGKLFALFVKAPAAQFNRDRKKLENIIDTFQLTGR